MQPYAIRTSGEIDDAELLGFISFQNIGEVIIHKDDLAQLFDKHGLDKSYMPEEIKPHDAFRRATSTASGSIDIELNGQVQTARLLVREVKRDNSKIVRHLVREIVDGKNEVLDYATVGRMTFNRKNAVMDYDWFPGYLNEYDYAKVLIDTHNIYTQWTQFHTKDTVRNIVNKVLTSCNPVSIQKGGRATFIPKNSRRTLMAIRAVVEELPSSEESIIETIPLLDTEDMRDLVARRATDTLQGQINEVLGDFDTLLKNNGHLTSDQLKRYIGKFAELNERTQEYRQLANRGLQEVRARVQEALSRVSAAPLDEEEEV